MRLKHITIMIIAVLLATTGFGQKLSVGEAAPDFSLKDAMGKSHNLREYRGNYVVLEWVNYDCPFVKKHYEHIIDIPCLYERIISCRRHVC